MSKIFLHLQKVHVLVHDLRINPFQNLLNSKNYSEPKIFTGGVNIALWSKLQLPILINKKMFGDTSSSFVY